MRSFIPTPKNLLPFFLICALLCSFSSCSSMGGQKKGEEGLATAIDRFNSLVRWEDYKSAAVFLNPPLKETFWQEMDLLQRFVRILDFQIRDVSMGSDMTSGNVTLRFRYYCTDDPNVQTKTVQQNWRFLEKEKSWQVAKHGLHALIIDKAKSNQP